MSYDFYAKYYGKPDIRNWNQYTILKCIKIGDNATYKKAIQQYKLKQINPHLEYTKWFTPSKVYPLDSSIVIKIDFRLKKYYISKDDDEFWPKDNPICKDKVFKVPLVRASSWKGTLRYSATRIVLGKSDEEKIDARLALLRLFGNEKDKIEDFLDDQFGAELKSKYKQKVKEIYGDEGPNVRGRLVFYPTFLDKIGLDIIAPHDRERRTVKVPIQFEVAPENAEGTFSVLYFPFDLLGREGKDVKEEVAQDLEILRDAIPAMLTKYGFGAKTTAGYGVAEIKKIEVNGRDCEINWNKALEVAKSEIGK